MKKERSSKASICRVSALVSFISIAYMFTGGAVLGAELEAPVIVVNPDVYYPLEEILYLEGSARPTSTIQIQFQKSGAKPITVTTKADVRGEWSFAQKVPLEAGEWEIRARIGGSAASDSSAWSNPRVVRAVSTGITLGGVTIQFVSIFLIVFIILLAAGAFIVIFYMRMRRFQANAESLRIRALHQKLARKTEELEQALLEKEKTAAKTAVEEGFGNLRDTVTAELEHLEKRSQSSALSAEEREHRELLLARLQDIEKRIEESIKHISKIHE